MVDDKLPKYAPVVVDPATGVLMAPVIAVGGDPAAVVIAFLEQVSPQDLEDRALNRHDNAESIPESFLAVLKEMANGH